MARGRMSAEDTTTLRMALVGYDIEKKKIEEKIREVRSALGGDHTAAGAMETQPHKRTMSAAARRRIAAAQRRRWAEHRKNAAKAAKSK